MAKIKPFSAYRYTGYSDDLTKILFPLMEKNGNAQEYNHHPHSIAFLSSSHESKMGEVIELWKSQGVISKDPMINIYVYYQYITDTNLTPIACRKGFISLIKLEDWEAQIILKHEHILPEIEEFQVKLLSQTKMHMNPIHGLFTDEADELNDYMEESMLNPIFEMKDEVGITHKLSLIQDKKCIEKFIEVLKTKKVVIADGHHRYAAALKLSKKNSHLNDLYIPTLLTNTENNHIPLLPFYRLLKIPDFNEEIFFQNLYPFFNVEEIKDIPTIQKQISQNLYTLGLITTKSSYIIELKSEEPFSNHPSSSHLRNVEEYLLGKLPYSENIKKGINYVHSLTHCVEEINSGKADIAILVKEYTIRELMTLSDQGLVLPEKSTYFYPKVLGGIVMSSIDSNEGENESPCFKDI